MKFIKVELDEPKLGDTVRTSEDTDFTFTFIAYDPDLDRIWMSYDGKLEAVAYPVPNDRVLYKAVPGIDKATVDRIYDRLMDLELEVSKARVALAFESEGNGARLSDGLALLITMRDSLDNLTRIVNQMYQKAMS